MSPCCAKFSPILTGSVFESIRDSLHCHQPTSPANHTGVNRQTMPFAVTKHERIILGILALLIVLGLIGLMIL